MSQPVDNKIQKKWYGQITPSGPINLTSSASGPFACQPTFLYPGISPKWGKKAERWVVWTNAPM